MTRSVSYLAVGTTVLVALWFSTTKNSLWRSSVAQQLWADPGANRQAPVDKAPVDKCGVTDNDVYCWLVTPSSGEEADLVRDHWAQCRNVFSCKGWSVFTDYDALDPVPAVTNIGSVTSNWGPWGSHLNTEVFVRAWDAMIALGHYKAHPWMIKTEAQTVFFAWRFKYHVQGQDPNRPLFLKKDGMLQSPIEVFSRGAVDLYAGNKWKCNNQGAKSSQEDFFFDYCMHTMGAVPIGDRTHLMTCGNLGHCPGDLGRCSNRDYLAFHPFKTSAIYGECLATAHQSDAVPVVEAPGFCCTYGTSCYSCPWSNKQGNGTYCGKDAGACAACGEHAKWCEPRQVPVQCGSHQILTLYHQTSNPICDIIINSNFRPGHVGWCGGGIYFAVSAQATNQKTIGPESKKGCILQVKVDVGKPKYMGQYCDRGMNGQTAVLDQGFQSVTFDPSDGQEYVVYRNSQILSIRRYGWWLPDAAVKAAYWDVPGR